MTDLLNQLGPGVTVTYVGQEGDGRWWCELKLPSERYAATLVTADGVDADDAFANTVAKALGYRREQEVA